MIDPLALGSAFIAGAALASAFWSWRFSTTPKQIQLIHENLALTIIADSAIGRLTDEQCSDMNDEVAERMEDAFGENAEVNIEVVSDE